ncbi:LysR substrate-binding domain-containing protein [Halomonadaceae bacterium KBTZ08]
MAFPITIDALRVLDAIARKGSFAAAAEEMHRVPSAISYTVHKLEEDLDVLLFDRSGHRATLTDAGNYLLAEGRQLLEAANTLARTTRRVAEGWETSVTIAVDALLPMTALFPAISTFNELDVPVEIHLMDEVFNGPWDALHTGRADLIAGASREIQPPGHFDRQAIGQVPFVYAVARDHPLTLETGPLSEEVLSAWPAVVAADSSRQLPAGSAGIFAQQRTLTVSSMDHKIEAQKAGLGVGWLPHPQVASALASGELVALDVATNRSPVVLCMAKRRGDQGKAINWFWEHLSRPDYFSPWLNPV